MDKLDPLLVDQDDLHLSLGVEGVDQTAIRIESFDDWEGSVDSKAGADFFVLLLFELSD